MFKIKKQLGQNFLKNEAVVQKIIESSEIKPTDTIIEVGPGTGILTEKLVKTGAAIFAIEKDFDLLKLLEKNIGTPKNLKIVHQDALLFDLSNFDRYKVVANIPYQITSPLIRKFIEGENKPELLVLMVQKEVAERITAKPGSSERGFLTLIVEFYADTEIVTQVPKTDFYPVPKVDSAVIKIIIKKELPKADPDAFFKVVKAGFAAKRRQVHNSLSATLRWPTDKTLEVLDQAGIDPKLRAEDLTLNQWLSLYEIIVSKL